NTPTCSFPGGTKRFCGLRARRRGMVLPKLLRPSCGERLGWRQRRFRAIDRKRLACSGGDLSCSRDTHTRRRRHDKSRPRLVFLRFGHSRGIPTRECSLEYPKKFVDAGAVGYIAGVAVKGDKCE